MLEVDVVQYILMMIKTAGNFGQMGHKKKKITQQKSHVLSQCLFIMFPQLHARVQAVLVGEK